MAYIKPEFIEDLLSKVDIKDIVTDYTEIKKKGAHFFGLSPFTKEETASFCVNIQKQRFNCYSSGKSGNVVSFLMEYEHLTYPEAIEIIAKKYGISVQYEDFEKAKKYKKIAAHKETLRPLLSDVLEAYQKSFVKLPKNHPAKAEIYKHRKYSTETVLDWQIGYAPGNGFVKNLAKTRLKEAKELGLISDKGDKLWNRVTYPIHDVNGLLIGFASRDLSGKKKSSKWMNPLESIVYKKSHTWFGLNRAKRSISDKDEAWIVEGYNDVIAWHTHGLENTVASCGTYIDDTQIKILKRYCSKINFCFDFDKAGNKSMRRYIPILLKYGFRVEVIQLPNCDPDDFVRLKKSEIDKEKAAIAEIVKIVDEKDDFEEIVKTLDVSEEYARKMLPLVELNLKTQDRLAMNLVLNSESTRVDGFKVLMNHHLKGNEIERSRGAQSLCKVISKIEDDGIVEIYIAWLQKESKVVKTTLTKWIKKFVKDAAENTPTTRSYTDYQYNLPKDVTIPFEDLKDDIYKYSLFMANNKIYMLYGEDGNYSFAPQSNFSIEIIQHMNDEKFPMKLVRVKNVHNLEKIFDVPSEYLNTPQAFDNAVTAHGNYLWTGGRNEFQKLRAYLFDKMGTGRKIDVLGWQSEGFWVWNNAVTLADGTSITVDENGIFVYDKVSYYIPSANKIYRSNQFKYDAQKRFSINKSSVSFKTFTSKMIEVHRNHAITGILFSLASAFQDIVVKELGNFPIMFLYGPASTGKDQLAAICQSFFGIPQTAINLEGNASTIKAKIREFAQFSNSIGQLSEYKKGPHDGIIKGLWDRRGYKRGNIESHVGTESIPILSSVILTGNEYPDAEALITRLLWIEMTKSEFSDIEIKNFEELQDMSKAGISSFTNDILKLRENFKTNLQKKYRMFKETFTERMPEAKSRMISNVSILGATYEILKDEVDFPFSFTEMTNHFVKCTERQIRKLNSASIINKWWDCYLSSLRGHKDDRLQVRSDFKIEQKHLFFNFTNTYNKIQRQWWIQYHEAIPGKSTMMDQLKKDESFIRAHSKGVYMAQGKGANNTSAFEINLDKINITDEIFNAIEFQLSEGTIFENSDSPATPKKQKVYENEKQGFFEYSESDEI